jgi:hypothetical protein
VWQPWQQLQPLLQLQHGVQQQWQLKQQQQRQQQRQRRASVLLGKRGRSTWQLLQLLQLRQWRQLQWRQLRSPQQQRLLLLHRLRVGDGGRAGRQGRACLAAAQRSAGCEAGHGGAPEMARHPLQGPLASGPTGHPPAALCWLLLLLLQRGWQLRPGGLQQ